MASIFEEIFGYGGLRTKITNFLVESGFIWIVWVVVGILTIISILGFVKAAKGEGEILRPLMLLVIASVLSFIATGSAIIMIIPIAVGFGAYSVIKMSVPPLLREVGKVGLEEKKEAKEEKKEIKEEKEAFTKERNDFLQAAALMRLEMQK
ncbi:MAG: hypothetical protein ACP5JY_02970, partial [Candidatus Nanoarchaeia archaeon]